MFYGQPLQLSPNLIRAYRLRSSRAPQLPLIGLNFEFDITWLTNTHSNKPN